MNVLTPRTRAEIEWQRDRYPQARSAVLPSLWAVQHQLGYLSPEGMAEVAELLRLTPSAVSYTHLDVYKRQVMTMFASLPHKG